MSADQVGCNCQTKYVMDMDVPMFSCYTKHAKREYCVVASLARAINNRRDLAQNLLEALQALGVQPEDGYCFCLNQRQIADGHTGECRQAVAAIKKVEDGKKAAEHTYYECQDPCPNGPGCQYCDGGLGYCTICKGMEGSLPSECPEKHMGIHVADAVYEGQLDFKGGRWVLEPSMKVSSHHDLAKKEKP